MVGLCHPRQTQRSEVQIGDHLQFLGADVDNIPALCFAALHSGGDDTLLWVIHFNGP
jgi:hypothetical protein